MEVLDYGPDEVGSTPRAPWPRRLLVATAVVALLVGGGAGAWAERELNQPAPPAPAPKVTRISAVVVAPAGGVVTSSASAGGTVSDVTVAVVNEGADAVNGVLARWQGVENAEVGTQVSFEAIPTLAPGTPAAVSLPLWRPCGSGTTPDTAAPPTLLLTWSLGGVDKSKTISPYGLDRLWATLASQCPISAQGGVNPLIVTVGAPNAHPQRMTVRFNNQGNVTLDVRRVTITGGFAAVKVSRPTFAVHPHTASDVTLDITITDCRAAIEGQATAELTYIVRSGAAGPAAPSLHDDELSSGLGLLVYQKCGKG